jgi:ornithine cyclodeaminase
VAVRYLASTDAKVCACIGEGPVSKACFDAIALEARELKQIVVYDLVKEKAEAFVREASEKFGITGWAADSLEEAVRKMLLTAHLPHSMARTIPSHFPPRNITLT